MLGSASVIGAAEFPRTGAQGATGHLGPAGAPFPAGYRPPLATGIDWRIRPRLTGPARGSGGLPTTNHIFPSAWRANVFLTQGQESATCDSSVRWVWKVKPPPGASLLGGQPRPGCLFTLSGARLGSYAVTATAQRLKNGKWISAGRTLKRDIELKDLVIVALGDSNGSGEGNPPFYYHRCDRSVASHQYEAALYAENQDRRSSVTLLQASCSGARIDQLVSTPYVGINPSSPPLPPQIKQVSLDIRVRQPERTVSAVIVSAGINDLAIGPVLRFCDKQVALSPNTPCQDLHVTPTYDSDHRVDVWHTAGSSAPTLRDQVATLQQQLLGRYSGLATALTRPVTSGGLGVKPGDVLITQYPDFTNGENGLPCGPSSSAGLATSTWAWLGQSVALLNRTVAAAAALHHWTLVPASAAFRTRGYCSPDSLIVSLGEAKAADDDVGAFHPDGAGQLIEAQRVELWLCVVLGLGNRCSSSASG